MSAIKISHPCVYQDDAQTHFCVMPVVKKILENGSNLRILELGCGNGYFSDILSKMGHAVIGVDISETGIQVARKSYPNVEFMQSDIYELEANPYFAGRSFDVIIALEVIEHLQYPKELIRISKKYLTQGGNVIISTPYHGYVKNLALSLLNKWDDHFSVFWDPGHLRFFSTKTLKKMFENEEFSDISFRCVGRLPLLWKSMICIAKK